MTQASDLGAIANQPGAFFRARLNANFQAVVSQHYGAVEPSPMYPNMIWFSSGDGFVKLRSPTNTSWQNIGTIGPPLKWTNIDLPPEGFVTGDIKGTYNRAQAPGWLHMNDGTIGSPVSGSQSRSNDDTWPLFNLLWNVVNDDWCTVYAAGTLTRTGRGASALADWNAARHIALPKMYGRVPASAGWGAGLSNFSAATWAGLEYVPLGPEHTPAHSHSFSATVPPHNHPLALPLAGYATGKSSGSGSFTLSDVSSGITWTENSGAINISGSTSTFGGGAPHYNIQPTTYVFYFIKL